MTNSTVRLWDDTFKFVASEDIPNADIRTTSELIRIEHRAHSPGGPLTAAVIVSELLKQRLHNLYITIDANPNQHSFATRRGGIINRLEVTEQPCACGNCAVLITTLLIEAIPHQTHLTPHIPETVYPPRGYGIGLLRGGNDHDTIIGCWATEGEAREALAEMRIVKLGDPR